MKRFGSRFVGTSLMAVALSLLAVGVVWASSAALRIGETTETTVPGEDGGEDDDEFVVDPIDDMDDLRRQVLELTATVDELTGIIATLESDVTAAVARAEKAADDAGRVASVADEAAEDAAEARRIAGAASDKITGLEAKTSKLNSDGIYSGTITPGQLSRRLTPTDLSGEWPLNRVTGQLETDDILVSAFGCSSDYRFHTVLTVDAFRQLRCERIPK